MAIDWFAEPYQPFGSMAGSGARRVLGKPRLDPLTVLVRETAQNSWDARLSDDRAVEYRLDGWILNAKAAKTLRDEVFSDLPPSGLALPDVLERDELPVLAISDVGTTGLDGPTRADREAEGSTDFVDLVFNMGQPRDTSGGGGTYGFGKTITYTVSQAATVLIYTRTRPGGRQEAIESRLIGVAIGDEYTFKRKRFTGRHWWGRRGAGDEMVQPVTGKTADRIATKVGIRPFRNGQTGTTMVVLAPDFGGRSGEQAMTFMANAITWNFWPKLVGVVEGAKPPMRCTATWEGKRIAVPSPDEHPPLGAFVSALRAIHDREAGREVAADVNVIPVRSERPRRQLGLLALARAPFRLRKELDEGSPEDGPTTAAAFDGSSHHVALMRRVELVVQYVPGPELPVASTEWAGVFLNDADIDDAFATAEPPTHDEWQPATMGDKSHKRLVRLALRNLGRELSSQFDIASATPSAATGSAVVVADALAGLLAAVPGLRPSAADRVPATREPPVERRGLAKARERLEIVDVSTALVLRGDVPVTEVSFTLEAPSDPTEVRVEAKVSAAIAGAGREAEPPIGADVPRIIDWRRADSRETTSTGPGLTTAASGSERWILSISHPENTAVLFDLNVTSTEA